MSELALIFDFGNVVGFFDHARSYRYFARRLGVDERVLSARVIERGGLELLRRFECGQVAPLAFAQGLMEIAEIHLAYDEFVAGWVDIFWPNETIARLVAALKSRDYKLLLGSNTNALHAEHYCRQFAQTLGHFDRLIFSHELGCMKPDRRFYLACVEAAGLPASSCVFIDDMEENVQGASRAGLIGVHYTDTPGLVSSLRGLGVDVATGESRT
jgi:glucose-1-phosphatase